MCIFLAKSKKWKKISRETLCFIVCVSAVTKSQFSANTDGIVGALSHSGVDAVYGHRQLNLLQVGCGFNFLRYSFLNKSQF